MHNALFSFIGSDHGAWQVSASKTIVGAALEPVKRIEIVNAEIAAPPSGWVLRGVTSNARYVTRPEQTKLVSIQASLGRPEATCAALIPIKKSQQWWAATQDERREILETQSRHIEIGMRYLPAIARRLHHCRDLGEPFDFLTWFEFAPRDEAAFNELLGALRATLEWKYVEREVEIRLVKI